MAAQPLAIPYYSYAEYRAFEARSAVRHEYYFGEVFAMAGGTLRHSIAAGNAFRALAEQLPAGCQAFVENVQVAIAEGNHYVYPDVAVTCEAVDEEAFAIVAPALIIEVLSPSTEAYDRNAKRRAYMQLSSLIYYLLVDTKKIAIDCYERAPDGKGWSCATYTQISDIIPLPRIAAVLPLTKVYERLNIGAE